MKPTKKEEKEIMQVYEAYWAEYLNGNVEGMVSLLDESYTQVGSAESEVFSSKKEAVQFLVDTIDQVAGKLEMRNRSTNLEQQNGLVLIHELCDLYALADKKWTFYSKFRATTLLTERKEGWKIIHQHSSFPDSKTEEGQNVAIDKIAEENRELREAVKRRTIELELKNRELEIETALEKVRAKSMAMYKSEELADLSLELVKQVQALGVATWFCAFNIYDEDQSGSLEWGSNGQGTFPKYRTPREGIFLRYYKVGQKGETLLINEIGEKECPAHYEYLCTLPGVGEQLLKMKENGIPFPKSQIDHVAYFKYGYVLFITYEPAPESHDIFKRFAKVFEQTYTRFLDLQKAEEQARESKIEAALERVRSASMAMHKSEEMQIVVDTIYEQLNALNFEMHAVGMSGAMNPKKGYEVWAGGIGLKAPLQIPYSEATKVQRDYNKVLIERTELFAKTYKGKIKKEYIDFLLHNNKFPSFLEKLMVESQAFSTTLATSKNSGMQILRYTEKPYTDSENAILLRFAKVFEQAYIRFMDLQKAEAQTREAQIQLSLERVRAKSMAMQSSDELHDVLSTLFQQFDVLGIKPVSVFLSLFDREKRTLTYRASGKSGKRISGQQTVSMDSLEVWSELFDKWKNDNSDEVEVIFYSKEILPTLFELLSGTFASMPKEERMTANDFPGGGYTMHGYTPFGYIGYNHTREATEEEKNILTRFATEFSMVYQRFLDIQKAEAQTREAQIEASLERIRARSMAMQQSDDLSDVLAVLFQQFDVLGIHPVNVWLSLYNKEEGTFTYRATGTSGKRIHKHQVIDLNAMDIWKESVEQWENGTADEVIVTHYPIDIFPQLMEVFKETFMAMPKEERIHPKDFPDGGYNVQGYCKFGYIGFNHKIPPTEEEKNILTRFATEFSMVYQRFLDIQKAEAQAREAQIEMALEKVRSRTMAMQNSSELPEAANNLFLQVQELGIPAWSAGYCIWEDDQKSTLCNMSSEGEIQKSFSLPTIGEGYNFYKPLKNKEPFHVAELGGKALVKHYDFMKTLPGIGEVLEDFAKKGIELPTFQIFHIVYFTHGYLMFITYETVPNDWEVFKRFGKVFEQTYTRFLDLKKAEAQAKEAQIETALERVRSRSMAMHKSEELKDVVKEIFDQMAHLKINADHAGIVVDYKPKKDFHFWVADKQNIPAKITVPYLDLPWDKQFTEAKKKSTDFFTTKLNFEEKNSFYKKLLPHIKGLTKEAKKFYLNCPGLAASTVIQKDIGLYIENFSGIPFSDAENSILMRFGKVFQQTYTRFLDLQKAEAQAREAQIENALEKVRSRTMAMQKSSELPEAANNLFLQVQELGIPAWSAGYCIWEDDQKSATAFMSSEGVIQKPFVLPNIGVGYNFSKPLKKGEIFHVGELGGNLIKKHYEFMRTLPVFGEVIDGILEAGHSLPTFQIFHICYFKYGYVMFITYKSVPKAHDIFKRFAKVFEQTYTRFLDLKKAEAQTREAKIEMALEKVRSRTMAMQKGEEVKDVVVLLYKELIALGVTNFASCGYVEINEETQLQSTWVTSPGGDSLGLFYLPLTGDVYFNERYEAWKKQQAVFHQTVAGKERRKHLEYAITTFNSKEAEEMVRNQFPDPTVFYCFNFSHGYLHLVTGSHLKEEEEALLARFTRVFEQTYARFLDLQKAEAQAREAQIENALEKVRSRTMAMHKSKEMLEVIGVVSEQLQQLNLNFDTVSFAKNNQEGDFTFWITSKGQPKPILMEVPTLDSPILKGVYKAQKKGIAFLADVFSSKENREWHEHLIKYSDLKHFPDKIKDFILNAPGFARSSFLLKNIDLYVGNYRAIPFTDEENSIFRRFAHVFEQSYTRFLDLQKAESQAREAQIEGALERVRSKTMAMHNSEDLEDIVVSLFDEVMNLGLDKSIRCGIGILEGHEGMETWSVNSNSDGTVDLKVGMLNMTIHPMLIGLKKAWKNRRKGYSYEYTAKDVRKYYEALNNEPEYPFNADLKTLSKQEFHRSFFFSSGIVFAFSENPISEESSKILARFAAVFGQTYQRFLDLQKAEVQAREATKQASLDRVRGQIASMRSTADLDRITPLVWNELITLGVPFSRCGVFIIDELTKIVEVYLSAPDGHSLGVLNLQFNADPLTKNTVDHWQKEKIFKAHWNREDFLNWTQSLMDQGQISDKNTYQGAANPPESLDLHFIPFTQGMLYVGSEHPLKDEHIALAQSLADAFAIAYARYEDFTKLEKAKKSVEATLSELKATQNQLVQSEKMASLGELTAGIAHEIQNPLNFVNNFSEVSSELIEEMNEEIEKGDMEEAKAIASDIKQNLEKINHHGKRADAIVKGMLQHSRSSTGVKEPTDINALADEYLRLAYHGLRAKDKSFNATMKTDYDDSLEKVNVIPQDIGRVILNLITNAFYVVDEKKKQLKDGYEPTVSVSTKKGAGKIEISVMDNGNGIPEKVKEKIFQPFFTTKPTGKGTGLGLSMSYDIVNKGHGGELTVETTEGKGTTFTIALPMV